MDDLSMLQKRVFVFIKSFMNNYGYPPTVREIAGGTDIGSTSTVHSALNALETKGYIYRDIGQSRSIVLAGTATESGIYSVPLLEENQVKIGFVDIPKSLVVDRQGVFAVKCSENIEEKNVLKGDIIIAKACTQNDVKDGDTVVYDNNTVGVYYERESYSNMFSDAEGYGESLAELYALDAFDEDVFEDGNEMPEKAIIGVAVACIRHF